MSDIPLRNKAGENFFDQSERLRYRAGLPTLSQ